MSLEPAVTPPPVQPVASGERIQAIDTLRGFALLGILPVNILAFAHVEAAYQNPSVLGDFTGLNLFTWLVTHLIFENKMVTIFSTLFGVGLFIQVSRAEERRGRVGAARGLYFRRVGWLLLFGLAHAYLLWYGDVLTYYALIGMLIYWVRRWKPRTQIILAVILLLLGSVLLYGLSVFLQVTKDYVAQHPEMVKEAKELKDMEVGFNPPPAKVAEEARKVREADFFGMVRLRAGHTLQFQAMGMLLFVFWRFSALMLLGIALYKLGGFSLTWSPARYWRWLFVGFGFGIPLTIIGTWLRMNTADMIPSLQIMSTWDYFGSLFMAAGYFATVMLLAQAGSMAGLRERLAAVGQMAFTNYLLQTVICTTIFHGWGFAQFGLWPLAQLAAVVITIWVVQLVLSPWWLRHFQFGPCEWLWRTLTYMKIQPMRRAVALGGVGD